MVYELVLNIWRKNSSIFDIGHFDVSIRYLDIWIFPYDTECFSPIFDISIQNRFFSAIYSKIIQYFNMVFDIRYFDTILNIHLKKIKIV